MIKTKYRVVIEIDVALNNIENVEEQIQKYLNCSGYLYKQETKSDEFTTPTVVGAVRINPNEEEQ